jgi:hypothetical protein
VACTHNSELALPELHEDHADADAGFEQRTYRICLVLGRRALLYSSMPLVKGLRV